MCGFGLESSSVDPLHLEIFRSNGNRSSGFRANGNPLCGGHLMLDPSYSIANRHLIGNVGTNGSCDMKLKDYTLWGYTTADP